MAPPRRRAQHDLTLGRSLGDDDSTESSFLSGGFMSTEEETSDTARFTDRNVNRIFVTVQHHLTALIAVSGSFTYEASVLQARRGGSDIDEDTVRSGAALRHLPTKNWTVSARDDLDRMTSGGRARETVRPRVDGCARCAF